MAAARPCDGGAWFKKRVQGAPQQLVPLGAEHARGGEIEFSHRGGSIDGQVVDRRKIIQTNLTSQGCLQLGTRTAQA